MVVDAFSMMSSIVPTHPKESLSSKMNSLLMLASTLISPADGTGTRKGDEMSFFQQQWRSHIVCGGNLKLKLKFSGCCMSDLLDPVRSRATLAGALLDRVDV